MVPYKDKDNGVLLAFNGRLVAYSHTVLGYSAFISAFIVGCYFHYHKIVQNEWFGYPEEWFPSVSATIGDRYPERSFFMIFIAFTSGPRVALVALHYLLSRKSAPKLSAFLFLVGIFRTMTCGGWTYVTSTDDHDWHDIFMIAYLVATIPWTAGCIATSKAGSKALKWRKITAGAFFGAIPFMIWFFIQHKVHRVSGAYTTYAFFEWSLVLSDLAFDSVSALDFAELDIIVQDNKGRLSPGAQKAALVAEEKYKEKAAIGFLSPQFSWCGVVDIAFDVYHGFVFWSILTSLGLLVWYFPLWYMGISGYEAMIMTSLSPFILVIPPIRSLVVNYQGVFHVLSLIGVAAYLVPKPTDRLFTVGAGVFFSILSWTGSFIAEASHGARLEGKITSFLLGLALSATAKYAWLTNNPIWPTMHEENGGLNTLGLVIGLVAAIRFVRRPVITSAGVKPVISASWFSSWLSAASVGGLMFALHSLLSDSSTMILWVWEGFPQRGPDSSIHGYLTLLTMTAGTLGGLYLPGLFSSWIMYGIGCVGAGLLTCYSHWTGYAGATILAAYLPGVAFPILATAAKKTPAMVFGFGFLIYNFMVLFHVWVVAYAFVPGGPLVREHTDWIMTAMMIQIGCGVLDINGVSRVRKTSVSAPLAATGAQRKGISLVAVIINVMFLVAAFFRFPTNDYQPYHADAKVLTVGIWTIHFSLDNDMWSSEKRMAALIREAEVDVIGLLESDEQRIIMGNRDSTQQLAHELGMYVDYGPGPNKHTWGAALLSKFPILNSTHHLLPSPVGELAPAIHATLDVYGELVDVFVFHSGQEEDPEDRRLQSLYLSELMGSSPRPSFLLSYLVTRPLEGNYNTYVSERSGMHDVDPSDWDRWCEYILYKNIRRVGYARISRSTITDTELQTAKFVLPKDDNEKALLEAVGDNVRNQRVNEEDVPEGWRYPALFRGEGVRGHRYHVFDEPRYYNF